MVLVAVGSYGGWSWEATLAEWVCLGSDKDLMMTLLCELKRKLRIVLLYLLRQLMRKCDWFTGGDVDITGSI